MTKEWKWRKFDIFMGGFHVAQVFESREMVEVLPSYVGKSDAEGDSCGKPKPLGEEKLALRRKEQRDNQRADKKYRRMFVEKAEAEEHTAPEKEFWLLAIDGEKQNVNATHPEQRFDGIHRQVRAVAENDRCEKNGDASEENRPTLAT